MARCWIKRDEPLTLSLIPIKAIYYSGSFVLRSDKRLFTVIISI